MNRLKIILWIIIVLIGIGYLLPQPSRLPAPVKGNFYCDPESYWYFPWGESGVHKGVDFFSAENDSVISPIYGLVIESGFGSVAGNYIYILGPKWKVYYFAHLNTVYKHSLNWVNSKELIGRVGKTGNAATKPPHLHFSIYTPFPHIGNYDSRMPMAWKQMFYLDPYKTIDTTGNQFTLLNH